MRFLSGPVRGPAETGRPGPPVDRIRRILTVVVTVSVPMTPGFEVTRLFFTPRRTRFTGRAPLALRNFARGTANEVR